jgi:hypothetical protein
MPTIMCELHGEKEKVAVAAAVTDGRISFGDLPVSVQGVISFRVHGFLLPDTKMPISFIEVPPELARICGNRWRRKSIFCIEVELP